MNKRYTQMYEPHLDKEKVRQRFIESIKNKLTPSTLLSLENCMNCQNCGSACAWFLTTGERKYHPLNKKTFLNKIYKRHITLEGKIANKLKLTADVSIDEIENMMDSFWKCTACGRCTLSCPMALNNRDLVHLARTAYYESGLSRTNPTLAKIDDDTIQKRHSFGLSHEQIYLRVGFFLKNEGIDVPVDVYGSDYLFICPSVGNTKIPDYGIKLPQILNASGVSYTISSQLIETGTEINHIVDNFAESKKILIEIEEEAIRLGVKYVVVAECGCDIRTFYAETSTFLNRPFRFPVIHIDSIILEHIKNGNIPVLPTTTAVTFHDPCKLSRQSGLGDMERELLHLVSNNVIEMTPNRNMNYCCNGGSGPMRLPENTEIRRNVSSLKAKQIENTGAKYVISPCAVCMLTLEDICKTYKLGSYSQSHSKRMSFMMFELVFEAMYKALKAQNKLEKMRKPAIFKQQTEAFIFENGFGKVLQQALNSTSILQDIEWLENDEVTLRYINNNELTINDLQVFLNQKSVLA